MNAKCRTQNVERGMQNADRRRRRARLVALVLYSAFIIHHSAFPTSAAPSQEEVFRSIQQNVGRQTEDGGKGLGLLLGGAGALMMVLLVGSKIRRRQATPRVFDHPGRLMREIMKTVPLKPKELKQLKQLADESAEPVQSPLTLLLCPSVLARALKNGPVRVDRAVLAQVVRKMNAEVRSQK